MKRRGENNTATKKKLKVLVTGFEEHFIYRPEAQKTEEKERRSVFNEIEAFVLSGFRRKKIRIFIYFFKIMLMWKTMGISEVSIIYILIIYNKSWA